VNPEDGQADRRDGGTSESSGETDSKGKTTRDRAIEIVKADPGILTRYGGAAELGRLLDVTPRQGSTYIRELRDEMVPAPDSKGS
jgi:hypothetical protein